MDAASSHSERRGGETIGLIHIGSHDSDTHEARRRGRAGMRIINMLSPYVVSRRGDAAVVESKHFHDFFFVERIPDAGGPHIPLSIATRDLYVAARFHPILIVSGVANKAGGIAYRPPFDDARWVERAVGRSDIKIAVGVDARLFRQCEHLAHLGAIRTRRDLTAIDTRYLTRGFVRTESFVHRGEIIEDWLKCLLWCADDLDDHGHSHYEPRFFHDITLPYSALPRVTDEMQRSCPRLPRHH